mmetsp:Transcript_24548/g.21730  ORF Transcript_24548/g.21730 Transcript_24548/m.21730 type:complete len:319 (-) Transcript_24548:242-1198(-)
MINENQPTQIMFEEAQQEAKTCQYTPQKIMRGNEKTGIYFATSEDGKDFKAMKVYSHNHTKSMNSYNREKEFFGLDHPNIIKYVEHGDQYVHRATDKKYDYSYIVMELGMYGDFHDVCEIEIMKNDTKLVRTYFQQLISGLYHLHNEGIAHLDIKPQNLILAGDFQLKICDFDNANKVGKEKIVSRGTLGYRAPELAQGQCEDPYAADVFSAGMTLFTMLFSRYAHLEGKGINGIDLTQLLYFEDPEKFLKAHQDLGTFEYIDEDFADLFIRMVALDSEDRITLDEIIESPWFNGEIYTDEELIKVMEEKKKYFKQPE